MTDNVHEFRGSPSTQSSSGGPPNGNGKLTDHRFSELERRATVLENKVDTLSLTCEAIKTKLDGLPSKSYVLTVGFSTMGALTVTLVGHLLIRVLVG